MHTYRFEITYSSKNVQEVSRLMKRLDLGDKEFAVCETYILKTSEENTIEKIKQLLTLAFESQDCKVWHIEGGKVG